MSKNKIEDSTIIETESEINITTKKDVRKSKKNHLIIFFCPKTFFKKKLQQPQRKAKREEIPRKQKIILK